MTRLATGSFTFLVIAIWSLSARAQSTGFELSAEAEANANVDVPSLDDPISDPLDGINDPLDGPAQDQDGQPAGDAGLKKAVPTQDIVVVPRRAFLKTGRVELQPFAGMSVNDTLITHYGLGGDITYFLSEVFGVGLQGMYMIKERSEREGLIGLQYNRVSALNRYLWQASLNFSYIPIYGKFALFNSSIIHWDVFVSGGVGATQTEIIPRKTRDESFRSINVTPNLGLGTRIYLFDWMTLNFAVRDYIFPDNFEPRSRMPGQPIDVVKQNADKKLVHNIMLYAGVGFYLPTSFNYRTAR